MRVGTMAFADTWEYSPSAHDHDCYTYTEIVPEFGPGDQMRRIATLSVGERCFDGLEPGHFDTVEIYCPEVRVRIPEEPPYGVLRFMYSRKGMPRMDSAYISSSEFDGWIYPDGSSYAVDPAQFAYGSNPFVTRGSNPFVRDGVLRAPDLRGRFISFNPFTDRAAEGEDLMRCAFEGREGHVAVPEHSHPITEFSAQLSLELNMSKSAISCTDDYNKYGRQTFHWGKTGSKPDKDRTYQAALSFKSGAVDINTRYTGGDGAVSEPSHWAMPVMVYVGGRLKAYEKTYFT